MKRWLLLVFAFILPVAVLGYGLWAGERNAAPNYYLALDLEGVSYLFAMDYVASRVPEESVSIAYTMWVEADIQDIGNGDWEIKAEWQGVSGTWRLTQEPPWGLNLGTYNEGAREIEDMLFPPLLHSPTYLREGEEPQRHGVLQCYQAKWEAAQPPSRRDLRVFGSGGTAYLKEKAADICREAGIPPEAIAIGVRE